MTKQYEKYQQLAQSLPETTQTWNFYGAGVENIGKDSQPERFGIPEPNDDQLLVRVDAVSLCFSDVKLITQGGKHPKQSRSSAQTGVHEINIPAYPTTLS